MIKKQPKTIRTVAWDILNQVHEKGIWAEVLLDKELGNSECSGLDQRLCRELVFGTMSNLRALDYQLDPLFKSGKKPKNNVRNLLRMGLYQMLFLDRIPDHAALYETVNCAKGQLAKPILGFINAILRSYTRRGLRPWPDKQKEPGNYLEVVYSMPDYLVNRWLDRYGLEKTEAFFKTVNCAPPMVLRVNMLKISRKELIGKFEAAGITCHSGVLEETLVIDGAGMKPRDFPGYKEGWFYFQDQSSQMIAHVIAPRSGQSCLDLCAAPGGKTTHLAELMGDKGDIIAFDSHDEKRKRIRENAKRLQLNSIKVVDDLDHLSPVDIVLVDAPCSGIGTMRRHAETKWRVKEKDFKRLASIQLSLLEQAAAFVKKDGLLVYSTCTTEPEENEEVVRVFLEKNQTFKLAQPEGQQDLYSSAFWHEDGLFRTFPDAPEMDGMFAARFKKQDS